MSDSEGGGSAPPDAEGDAVPAGGRRGRGRAGGAGCHAPRVGRRRGWRLGGRPKGSMFAPISMMELELRRRGDLDGASSTASDRGGSGSRWRRNKGRSSRGRESRRDAEEYDDGDDGGGASAVGSEADLAGAAFGGKRRSCVPCGGSEVSDDALSVASSEKRAAHARAFPLRACTASGARFPPRWCRWSSSSKRTWPA